MRTYRADHWRVCDVCGFDYRASETLKRWDGRFVCIADWEPRHPQDSVRAKMDRQRVANPRPQPADVFLADAGGTPVGLLLAITTASRNLG